MTLSALWRWLLSMGRDPWAGVEAWRKRRAELMTPSKPTYEAYPDTVEQAEMWLTIHARDAFGRVLGERVDLRGIDINHINLGTSAWGRDLPRAVADARKILRARLRLSAIHATKLRHERAEAERHRAFERAVALEAKEKARAAKG